jgi:hypothetical protein
MLWKTGFPWKCRVWKTLNSFATPNWLITMSTKLGDYLSEYIQGRVGVFKKYLIAALENKDQCIWYLESSEGMMIPSSDLKNCELLRDAQLLNEDIRISRNGRNTYKIYCLTDLGRKMAQQIRQEGLIDEEKEEKGT